MVVHPVRSERAQTNPTLVPPVAKTRAAAKTVKSIQTLAKLAGEKMTPFTFWGAKFDPADFAKVKPLIGNKIAIYVTESDDDFCRYTSGAKPTENDILLTRKSMNKKPFLGTIVHELMHAVNDLNGLKIHSSVDEGLCYVGQMMFLAKINVSSGGHPIFDAAQAVYDAIVTPKGKDRKKLEEALIAAVGKVYTPAAIRNYNGIK